MTDTYRVDVVKFGQWDWAPGFEIYWMDAQAPAEPLALVGVVIRGGGRTVLVNCGPNPDFLPTMNARWANFDPRHQLRVAADERLEPALAKVGVGLDDVDLVVVTPFQAYAIGNVLRFPRAEIGLSRRGWIDFHAPRWRDHPHDFRPFCIPDDVLVGLVTARLAARPPAGGRDRAVAGAVGLLDRASTTARRWQSRSTPSGAR